MRIHHAAAIAALALTFSGSPVARADTVTLKNGREIHGRLVEERADAIRIRTSGGTITIAKAEVATFSENENWGEYSRPTAATPQPATPTPPAEGEAPQPGVTPAPGGDVAPGAEEWTWDEGVSAAKREELTPLRDEYLTKLKELGPTKEERLAALKLTAEEEAALRDQIQRLGWKRRQGSANLRRRNAADEIVRDFGLKATPNMVQAVRSPNYWVSRMSIQTVKSIFDQAKDKDDARWYMYHLDAPSVLIQSMESQGDAESPFVRRYANEALEAITGHSVGFSASEDSLASPAEAAAVKKWQAWWRKDKVRWEQEQKDNEALRADLTEKLEKVRKGVDPRAESDEGSDEG